MNFDTILHHHLEIWDVVFSIERTYTLCQVPSLRPLIRSLWFERMVIVSKKVLVL